MAIINNHSSINLDADFQGDHSELLQFFFNQGLNVEITDDVSSLKTFLESLSDEEYPYNFDAAFTESFVDGDGFVLFLKNGDTIVSTYAAKGFDKNVFKYSMLSCHNFSAAAGFCAKEVNRGSSASLK